MNGFNRIISFVTGLFTELTPAGIRRIGKSEHQQVLRLWEKSVRASHDFLHEQDIIDYRVLMEDQYLKKTRLYALEENGMMKGFIGLSGDQIRLLFISPDSMRMGFGKKLLHFAIKDKQIKEVDVNGQNTAAYQFYHRAGFRIVKKYPFDGAGKPYPVWSLKLVETVG
ncbi:GNAT family N-acetyltransferase [Pedobacter frigidisoli]|uniref:GNAT family N-acetyltransferase n=1 Tax=Pedobacter frigidisoli TaxID=2530455 RepID=UPI002930FE93|nr:GNAT family N-acetyltransferase [Pedobacter frigidisoli]